MNSEEIYIPIEIEKPSFFFDTYAFFEILKGNSLYNKYTNTEIITTKLNLFELYLGVLRENTEENADNAFNEYFGFIQDFNEEVIKNAAKLKIKLNKRDLSMADCIGYEFAKQLGIKFLTGDNQFKDMENVEFVK